MKKSSSALAILSTFAQYGPEKVSMNDIAKAAGLSRQSIYNRFGSKHAALEWAVATVLTDATHAGVRAFAEMSDNPLDTVVSAFQKWTGEHINIWRGTPHGSEILDFAVKGTAGAEVDYEGIFFNALTEFLVSSGIASNVMEAEETTFTLSLISKGMLLKTDRSDEYRIGLERAFRVVCLNDADG